MKDLQNNGIQSLCLEVRTVGCQFCKQWRIKDGRGVFINKSLRLRRQIFAEFAKRSTVFIIAFETKHGIVNKFGTLSYTLKNILARILGNIILELSCQSDRKFIVNINRSVTKVPRVSRATMMNAGDNIEGGLPSGRSGESQQDGEVGDVQGVGNSQSTYASGVRLDV